MLWECADTYRIESFVERRKIYKQEKSTHNTIPIHEENAYMNRTCCYLARLHVDRLPIRFFFKLLFPFRFECRLHGLRFDRIFFSYFCCCMNRLFVFISYLNGILHARIHIFRQFGLVWLAACDDAAMCRCRYLGSFVLDERVKINSQLSECSHSLWFWHYIHWMRICVSWACYVRYAWTSMRYWRTEVCGVG